MGIGSTILKKWVGVVAVAVVVLTLTTAVHGKGLSPSQCKEERRLAINTCKPIVFGEAASPACCERVRLSHFRCVCPVFTPKVVSLINVNQAIKLFQGCGRKVPRHFKCGSLNFP